MFRNLLLLLLCISIFFLVVHSTSAPASTSLPVGIEPSEAAAALALYSVASSWPDRSLGNHRARLRLDDAKVEIAWARVEWRLPGLPMEDRQRLVIKDEATGEHVRNVVVLSASWEAAELLFEPLGHTMDGYRTYLIYYLTFDDGPCQTGPASSCTSRYGSSNFYFGRARAFRTRTRPLVEKADWRSTLPRAAVVAFEARTARDAFYPMEVAATKTEASSIARASAQSGRPVLIWPEERTHPVRMLDHLPLRWLAAGVAMPNASTHAGTSMLGEFYTFQIGVYAPNAPLNVRPYWGALHGPGGRRLEAWRVRCINTPNGSTQATEGLRLPVGGVQPFWFGVDVPSDATSGTYHGHVRIAAFASSSAAADGVPVAVERIAVSLVVSTEEASHRGDSELWRHSRLRWLDSNAGTGAVTAGAATIGAHRARADVWQPIRRDPQTYTLNASGNRVVRLVRRGLPTGLSVGATELLAGKIQLRLMVSSGGNEARELRWVGSELPRFTNDGMGGVSWVSNGEVAAESSPPPGCHHLAVEISGTLHTDGMIQLALTLRAPAAGVAGGGECALSDVQLQVPLRESATRLINGFGWKGAMRPKEGVSADLPTLLLLWRLGASLRRSSSVL